MNIPLDNSKEFEGKKLTSATKERLKHNRTFIGKVL